MGAVGRGNQGKNLWKNEWFTFLVVISYLCYGLCGCHGGHVCLVNDRRDGDGGDGNGDGVPRGEVSGRVERHQSAPRLGGYR